MTIRMYPIVFISGPPFDAPLWAEVEARLRSHGFDAESWALFRGDSGRFQDELERLMSHLASKTSPTVLVGHGLGNPLVAAASCSESIAGVVYTNGAFQGGGLLYRAVQALSAMPNRATMPWLRSSFGLRRLVVNPYVMDHDTTVAVCAPILKNKTRRQQMREFIRTVEWPAPNGGKNTLLCCGDGDRITDCNGLNFRDNNPENITLNPIPGGRFLHPLERPWELADRIAGWLRNEATATQMS